MACLYSANKQKLENKYRTKSARLKDWDYRWSGWYFITICVKNFRKCLGKIEEGKVALSLVGKEVNKCWLEIPKHFPFVELDEYMIMPNHMHGIIVINNPIPIVETHAVETCHGKSLQPNGKFQQRHDNSPYRQFGTPLKNSLSTIINQFKGSVKRQCNKSNIDFSWQPRFYDHIIRNEKSYLTIKKYIYDNPIKWDCDEYY